MYYKYVTACAQYRFLPVTTPAKDVFFKFIKEMLNILHLNFESL